MSFCIHVRLFTICGLIPPVSKGPNMCSCWRVCLMHLLSINHYFSFHVTAGRTYSWLWIYSNMNEGGISQQIHCSRDFGISGFISQTVQLFPFQNLPITTDFNKYKKTSKPCYYKQSYKMLFDIGDINDATDYC